MSEMQCTLLGTPKTNLDLLSGGEERDIVGAVTVEVIFKRMGMITSEVMFPKMPPKYTCPIHPRPVNVGSREICHVV